MNIIEKNMYYIAKTFDYPQLDFNWIEENIKPKIEYFYKFITENYETANPNTYTEFVEDSNTAWRTYTQRQKYNAIQDFNYLKNLYFRVIGEESHFIG